VRLYIQDDGSYGQHLVAVQLDHDERFSSLRGSLFALADRVVGLVIFSGFDSTLCRLSSPSTFPGFALLPSELVSSLRGFLRSAVSVECAVLFFDLDSSLRGFFLGSVGSEGSALYPLRSSPKIRGPHHPLQDPCRLP
jgi:hypothetical protein